MFDSHVALSQPNLSMHDVGVVDHRDHISPVANGSCLLENLKEQMFQ